jgi:uncharacterized membrane protein YbhN (UPF0104 family)
MTQLQENDDDDEQRSLNSRARDRAWKCSIAGRKGRRHHMLLPSPFFITYCTLHTLIRLFVRVLTVVFLFRASDVFYYYLATVAFQEVANSPAICCLDNSILLLRTY